MVYSVKEFALQRGGEEMFEKNLTVSDLLVEYGAVLTERHRVLLSYYYDDDLSLAEIAQLVGISRQGVRDGIKKAEEELFFLERGLRLMQRSAATRACAERILCDCSDQTRNAVLALLREMELLTVDQEESEGVPHGNV